MYYICTNQDTQYFLSVLERLGLALMITHPSKWVDYTAELVDWVNKYYGGNYYTNYTNLILCKRQYE
jgi:hypothetical protein